MRTGIAAAAIAMNAAGGLAHAAQLPDREELTIPPWYAQGHVGIFVPSDTNVAIETDTLDFGTSGEFVDPGLDLGGVIGYQLTDVWAIEGEIAFRSVAVDENLGDDIKVVAPMVNLSARWPVDFPVEPYLTVGVGYAKSDTFAIGLDLDGQEVEDELSGSFAWQAKVGVDVYVRDANAVGLEAVWFQAGTAEGDVPLAELGDGRLGLDVAGFGVRATFKVRF